MTSVNCLFSNLGLTFIGFLAGIIVSQIIEFNAFNTNISTTSNNILNEGSSISLSLANVFHTKRRTVNEYKNINLLDGSSSSVDELLYGLSQGLNQYKKTVDELNDNNKKIRMVYIVGNEGSGHHLWENIIKQMAKNSDKISADYIENESLIVKLMHSCFIELHHKQKKLHQIMESKEGEYYEQALSKAGIDTKHGHSKPFVTYACNAFEIELKNIYDKLPDDSLIYMRSYSYPYFGLDWSQIPEVPYLVQLADKMGFDVKLIVMKREWVNTFVSSCIHRFGQCKERVMFTNPVISLIQSHLFSLDKKFWIMIDYEDFMQRSLEYVDIINEWLKINDKEFVTKIFKKVIKPSEVSVTGSGWKDMEKGSGKQSSQLIKKLFYEEHSKYLWPLYNEQFIVRPENSSFYS